MSGVKRILLLAALPLLALAPALSQQSAAAPKAKGGSNAPVDVGADRIEVQDRANRAILTGNVVATQGNMTMNSARLNVIYAHAAGSQPAGSTGTQIQRLEASGGVVLHTPTETARSQFAIYDVPRRLVTMIGAVNLDQGANHVQGGRLVLDLDTHRAVVDGGAAGSQSRGGRVTGHFTVPPRENSGSTPAHPGT
jgi:lipopolysaccharide export system protein LptA